MTTIKSYDQAAAFLGNKSDRPFAHNTRITRCNHINNSVIEATYHGNVVARFFNGYTEYSSCGWKTPTTKERINWFLPEGWGLYQEKSVWYLIDRSGGWETASRYIFKDGIYITSDKQVGNAGDANQYDETKKLIKRIKVYVDGWLDAFFAGNVPAPSNGDCWGCAMTSVTTGKTVMGSSHLVDHMDEQYYVPSLLMRAMEMYPVCELSKSVLYCVWGGGGGIANSHQYYNDIFTRDVTRSLTRYMKHEFGIADK